MEKPIQLVIIGDDRTKQVCETKEIFSSYYTINFRPSLYHLDHQSDSSSFITVVVTNCFFYFGVPKNYISNLERKL